MLVAEHADPVLALLVELPTCLAHPLPATGAQGPPVDDQPQLGPTPSTVALLGGAPNAARGGSGGGDHIGARLTRLEGPPPLQPGQFGLDAAGRRQGKLVRLISWEMNHRLMEK